MKTNNRDSSPPVSAAGEPCSQRDIHGRELEHALSGLVPRCAHHGVGADGVARVAVERGSPFARQAGAAGK
eukprot:4237663-Alexandrium_andersonii.AAC.1